MKALPSLALLPLTLGLALPAEPEPARAPNIIFIMVDDMGYGDLGIYGQDKIQTPRLDQMAREGMRFSQVYAGSPVCAPARSVLMTGQHSGNTRVRGNFGTPGSGVQDADGNWRVPLQPDDVTVAEVLKATGYVTGITGKWGLGEEGTTGIPNLQGFDEWYGLLNQRQAHSHYPAFLWRDQTKEVLEGNTGTFQDFVTEAHYLHDLLTDFAFGFIDRHAEGGSPFFLYLPYTIPHSAFQIPELEPYTVNTNWTQREKVYASMLTRMDRDVGRILDRLVDLGIAGETLVFFCSDNGAADRYEGRFDSSGPLRGRKRDVYEGGIRTVMIAHWPGTIAPDVGSDAIWSFADVLPTLADAAGVPPPSGIDGVSVLPTLFGELQPDLEERALYWEFHEGQFAQAIRMGRWKAVRQNPGEPTELYDLSVDVGETNNVASEHPGVVAAMEERFITLRSASTAWPTVLDDAEPLPSDPDPEPDPDPEATFDAGWLPLSETGGFAAIDHSYRGAHAVLQNFETSGWGSDASGGSLAFNGVDQSLRIQGRTGVAGDGARTVAAWIRTSESGAIFSWGTRSGAGHVWTVRIDPATRALRAEVQNGYVIGSTPLTNNQWRHVAAVFDPERRGTNVSGVQLFVDGVEEVISASLAQPVQTAAGTPMWIGGEDGRSDLYFSGDMRHVQWWTKALGTTAVAVLADPGLSHAARWVRTHFPQAKTAASDPAPGTGWPLLIHYAAGRLPAAGIVHPVTGGVDAEGRMILTFAPDPRARIEAAPVYARDLSGEWLAGAGIFESLPPEDGLLRWRGPPHENAPFFGRLVLEAAEIQ